MPCNEALNVQALFDGELDATAALEMERHLESCADCAGLLKDLQATRSLLRERATYHRADERLRRRIEDALGDGGRAVSARGGSAAPRRGFLWGLASGVGASALAAALAFLLVPPPAAAPLVNDVVNAHLRSMMSDHLIDVASSDRHTVKPWFAGHTDVSPPAADFSREGYKLVGGRADYVDGHRAAVVVYRHGAHIINVFAWADSGAKLPEMAIRNGYHVVFWKSGNLAFCAVSDAALDELLGLVRLVKATTVPDSRE